jgi:hypothetical protein
VRRATGEQSDRRAPVRLEVVMSSTAQVALVGSPAAPESARRSRDVHLRDRPDAR